VAYEGAGTVEFLLDPAGPFYFIEMNTRVQVEHPVTELVTGVDIVRAQLDLACGGAMPRVEPPRGHAIECRIIAEDPRAGFVPSPGTISRFRPPAGPGVRVDAGVTEGSVVSPAYDSLLAKLVVHAEDRERARARAARALAEFELAGVATTVGICRDIIESDDFAAMRVHTRWLEDFAATRGEPRLVELLAAVALGRAPNPSSTGAATGRAELPSPFHTLGDWR
jgi:acetyl/propionyl-CoA carboxylase alpha subunit